MFIRTRLARNRKKRFLRLSRKNLLLLQIPIAVCSTQQRAFASIEQKQPVEPRALTIHCLKSLMASSQTNQRNTKWKTKHAVPTIFGLRVPE